MDHHPRPGPSDRLALAIAAAIADNRLAADGRAVRRDGWTAERIRRFLAALSAGGCVTRAAAAAGVTARAAYKFRSRAQGRGFADAWDMALEVAHPIRPFASRVLHGSVRISIRDGHVWERHFFDNGLLMATLRRLDRQAEASRDAADALHELGFEALVDRACACAGAARPARDAVESRAACQHRELSGGSEDNQASGPPDPTPPAPRPAQRPRMHARTLARRDRPLRDLSRGRDRRGAGSGRPVPSGFRFCRHGHDPPRSIGCAYAYRKYH